MKNIPLALVLTLFISSCAMTHGASSTLYQEYSQYRDNTNKSNIVKLARYFFSPSLLGSNYQISPDASSQLLFKNYMIITDSHYERANEHQGCLTVNGYDEENSPLTFSLKYISNDSRWLIDDIHVAYVKNAKDFASTARCPSEYAN